MTNCLIQIKHRYPAIWDFFELVNSAILGFRPFAIKKEAIKALSKLSMDIYEFGLMQKGDLAELSEMLNSATEKYMEHFHPHPFDIKTLYRLHNRKSMVMMKVVNKEESRLVGYFFLRCYFVGIAFHGLYVEPKSTNRGIGTAMWRVSSTVCKASGFSMKATVSQNNQASLVSMHKGCRAIMQESLGGNYNEYILFEK